MHKQTIFLVFIMIVALSACSAEQDKTRNAGNIASIDSLVQDAINKDHIPGAVVRIQQGDSTLHFKAYGFAQKYEYGLEQLEEPEKMMQDHIFDLASLTKVFATTYGIMLLADQGDISIDEPIYKYLPEFNEGEKRKITVRQLLS
ncbi:MAG: serine hydrolase domain-containing protein, partial [Candidatus Halalkalibacterium sp. M3_1C_030]